MKFQEVHMFKLLDRLFSLLLFLLLSIIANSSYPEIAQYKSNAFISLSPPSTEL